MSNSESKPQFNKSASPGPMPRACKAAIKATEPLLQGTPPNAPQYSAHSLPKAFDSGPLIQYPEFKIRRVVSRSKIGSKKIFCK